MSEEKAECPHCGNEVPIRNFCCFCGQSVDVSEFTRNRSATSLNTGPAKPKKICSRYGCMKETVTDTTTCSYHTNIGRRRGFSAQPPGRQKPVLGLLPKTHDIEPPPPPLPTNLPPPPPQMPKSLPPPVPAYCEESSDDDDDDDGPSGHCPAPPVLPLLPQTTLARANTSPSSFPSETIALPPAPMLEEEEEDDEDDADDADGVSALSTALPPPPTTAQQPPHHQRARTASYVTGNNNNNNNSSSNNSSTTVPAPTTPKKAEKGGGNNLKGKLFGLFNKKKKRKQSKVPALSADVADKDGITALMDAAKRGNLRLVKQLIEMFGADPLLIDSQGRNALMHALEAGNVEVAAFLRTLDESLSDTDYKAMVAAHTVVVEAGDHELTNSSSTDAKGLVQNVNDTGAPQHALLKEIIDHLATTLLNKYKGNDMLHIVMLNYPVFTDLEGLLDELQRIYNKPHSDFGPGNMRASILSRVSIITALSEWRTVFPHDLEAVKNTHPFLMQVASPNGLEMFTSEIIPNPTERTTIARPLVARLRDEQVKFGDTLVDPCLPAAVRVDVPIKTLEAFEAKDILSFSAQQIAHQLCLMDAEMLKFINAREFIRKRWTRKKTAAKDSPNILYMINQFNLRGNWVAALIVGAYDINVAYKLLDLFIKVASLCRKAQNFFGAQAISSGLYMTPVHRLHSAWDRLSNSKDKQAASIKALFTSTKNYAELREVMRGVQQSEKPFVVNLSLVCNDVFKLEEIDTFVDKKNKPGVINLNKFIREYDVLKLLLKAQQIPYEYKTDEVLQMSIRAKVHELSSLTEEDLFDLSYQIEPKSEEHLLLIQWKRATMQQRAVMLYDSRGVLESELDPILAARAARAEKERKQQEKEDLLLKPYREKVAKLDAWLLRDRADEKKYEIDLHSCSISPTPVQFLTPNSGSGNVVKGSVQLRDIGQGNYCLHAKVKKSTFGKGKYVPIERIKLNQFQFYKGTAYGQFAQLKKHKNKYGALVVTLIHHDEKSQEVNIVFDPKDAETYDSWCNILKNMSL